MLKRELLKLHPSGRHVETSRLREPAINRPPCNQHAYLTIRVPCIYRLDGLTRRTSRDFNKRNRWGLSKRPREYDRRRGRIAGCEGEVKSTRGHTERRLETAGAAAATVTFAETTSRRSSNGTVSPFGSHTKESSTSSGIATTMTSTRMRGETMTGDNCEGRILPFWRKP